MHGSSYASYAHFRDILLTKFKCITQEKQEDHDGPVTHTWVSVVRYDNLT